MNNSGMDINEEEFYEFEEIIQSIETADTEDFVELASMLGYDLQTDFIGANLSGTNLSGVNLSGANFSKVDLSNVDISQAILSGTNLSEANLNSANLRVTNLRGANLSGANLNKANLSEADLRGVNLAGATLQEADLRRADLRGADLENSNLIGTDLRETDLGGTNLSNIKTNDTTKISNNSVSFLYDGQDNSHYYSINEYTAKFESNFRSRNNKNYWILCLRFIDVFLSIILLFIIKYIFPEETVDINIYNLAATLFLVFWMIFKMVGLYSPLRIMTLDLLFTRLSIGWLFSMSTLLFIGFATHNLNSIPPILVGLWSLCSLLTMLGIRLAIWPILRKIRERGLNHCNAVIVGINESSIKLAKRIKESPKLGIKILGFFDNKYINEYGYTQNNNAFLGSLDLVHDYVKSYDVDQVYITLTIDQEYAIPALFQSLQDTTARIYYVPSVVNFRLSYGRSHTLNGIPLIDILEEPFFDWQDLMKRIFDIFISISALLIFFPLILLISIIVKLSSPGPIIFRQCRYSPNGKEIDVYKFRTMRLMEEGYVPSPTRGDSRITRIGAFLRKTNLDELPQFFNVLQGSMSIVGPRPLAVAHNQMHQRLIDGYLLPQKMKPGITGLAQLQGYRGEIDTLDKMQKLVELDVEYIKGWSLGLDIQIILRSTALFLEAQFKYL